MFVPSQESERSCMLGVSILPLSTILTFDFRIVPTVWYFFVFHFILLLSTVKCSNTITLYKHKASMQRMTIKIH